jgi:hypothetical protein
MNRYHYSLFCLVLSNLFYALQAQNDGGNDISPESIDIVKPYEPILADAVKAEFSPDLPSLDDLARDKPVFNDYYITPKFLTVKYDPVPLKPIGYDDSDKKKNKDKNAEKCRYVWLRGGYGNLSTPLADIALSTCRTKKWVAGLQGSYISSNGEIDFKDYSRIAARAFGKFYTGSNYIGIDGGYKRNTYYQYGYDHSDTTLNYTADQLLRRYQTIGVGAELGNSAENKQVIDYKARLDYNLLSDNRNSKEHYIDLNGNISGLINENLAWGTQLRNEFSSLSNSETDSAYSNNLLQATPNVTYKAKFGNFTGGLTAILDGGDIYPFPHLALEVFAVPQVLSIYGGWNKEGIKNTYQSLSAQNPFVGTWLPLQNARRENRYLGLKGFVGKNFSYNLKGFYNVIKNQALFVNEDGDTKQFTAVYDPNMSEIGATLELAARFADVANLSLTTTYAKRNTEAQLEAWHLPPISANLRADIMPISKLKLTVDAYVMSGMKARTLNPFDSYSAVDINTIFDLNLAARFAITDNIGIFATANNLLFQKYDRFLNYDVYGLNAIGGITLRF